MIPPGDPLPVDDRTPPTVIVVDDDDLFALWLTDLLRAEGCVVEREPDGLSALARLRRRPMPDLLMLDLMMPEMDGWAFYAEMRRNPAFPKIPVIVLTASDRASRSDFTGVVDFFTKQANAAGEAQLRALLRAHLDRVRSGETRAPTYRIHVPTEFLRVIASLPADTRDAVQRQLDAAAGWSLVPTWTPGDPQPTATLRVDDCRVLVELDQVSKTASVIAMLDPTRGWIGFNV